MISLRSWPLAITDPPPFCDWVVLTRFTVYYVQDVWDDYWSKGLRPPAVYIIQYMFIFGCWKPTDFRCES